MTDLPAPGANQQIELRFSQRDFDTFARISGDDNPIHVDAGFSAGTRFGRTVAHGMFLFGHCAAATARWLGGPVHLLDQRLIFTAPTYAEDDLRLDLEIADLENGKVTVAGALYDSSGRQTAAGTSVASRAWEPLPVEEPGAVPPSPPFKGLEVGMRASMTRTFSSGEVSEYCTLVEDPNPLFRGPDAIVPPALIGGEVSCLLGVELPGPGANWLKQHYRFLQEVPVNRKLHTTVGVSRLRPDKALVNLHNSATVSGSPVMTGETLVLAADVADRSR